MSETIKPAENRKLIEAENFDVTLPIKLTNGNRGRQTHWGASARRRKEYESLLRTLGFTKDAPAYRQRMVITRMLGKAEKSYDSDSLSRGNAKEIVDSMKACGWFVDDSERWLDVDFGQDGTDRKNGFCIKIQVRRVD